MRLRAGLAKGTAAHSGASRAASHSEALGQVDQSPAGSHELSGQAAPRHQPPAGQSDSDNDGAGGDSGGSELQCSLGPEDGRRVLTGPGGVQMRLGRGATGMQGPGSRTCRQAGDAEHGKGGSASDDQGSSDEYVIDLDGDGTHIQGTLGGGSDGESEGASSFDSRDYDMPAGSMGAALRGGPDTAASGGRGGGSASEGEGEESGGRGAGQRAGRSIPGREGKVEKKQRQRQQQQQGGKQGWSRGNATGADKAGGEGSTAERGARGKKRGKDIKALLKANANGNRLGQKARRALLEKLYGHNARHVQLGLTVGAHEGWSFTYAGSCVCTLGVCARWVYVCVHWVCA